MHTQHAQERDDAESLQAEGIKVQLTFETLDDVGHFIGRKLGNEGRQRCRSIPTSIVMWGDGQHVMDELNTNRHEVDQIA